MKEKQIIFFVEDTKMGNNLMRPKGYLQDLYVICETGDIYGSLGWPRIYVVMNFKE